MLPLIIARLAPVFNCIQLIPQLHKTYISKSVEDLSLYSLIIILITNFLWLSHGYFISDNSLIIAGIISLIINLLLLTLFFIYKNK